MTKADGNFHLFMTDPFVINENTEIRMMPLLNQNNLVEKRTKQNHG